MMPREMNAPAEHITNDVPPQVAFQWGHNSCLDQATPILARKNEEVALLKKENEELKRRANFTYCAYCGKEYPLDTDGALISEHIKTCDKHPLVQRIASLEDALKRGEGLPSKKEIMDVLENTPITIHYADMANNNQYAAMQQKHSQLADAILALLATRGKK